MTQLQLITGDPVRVKKTRLIELRRKVASFKALHRILTHSNRDANDPAKWLAALTPELRLDNGKPLPNGMGLAEMMAEFGRLMDDNGATGYGLTECEAIRDLCTNCHIACTF